MDLGRAANKFTNSPIYYWDKDLVDWYPTECNGALQAFDRFVTERTFGQKKRILLVGRDEKLDADIDIIRLEGSEESFLVEKYNEDVRFGDLYSYIYLIHEAAFYVDICKDVFQTNSAGAKVGTGTKTVIESTWIDIDRFTAAPSRTFEETEYTVTTMTFPKNSIVDTDCYLLLPNGDRYNVDEIYTSLDLIGARGKRIGV